MITREELQSILHYDKNTGVFTKLSNGKEVKGSFNDNYKRIQINKKRYYLHRLAYLYEYGFIPDEVDHINRNRSDNRIVNLRDGSGAVNRRNKSLSYNNTSGKTGVKFYENRNRWVSTIYSNSKPIHLGTFDNLDEAIKARIEGEIKYGYKESSR